MMLDHEKSHGVLTSRFVRKGAVHQTSINLSVELGDQQNVPTVAR